MNLGQLAVRTSIGTASAAALEIIAAAGGNGCKILRLRMTLVAATASVISVGRPAAKGVTPTSPVRLLSLSGGDLFGFDIRVATAWATPPTVPASFYTRDSVEGAIGKVLDLDFGAGIVLQAGETLVVWNIGTNSVLDVTVTGTNG